MNLFLLLLRKVFGVKYPRVTGEFITYQNGLMYSEENMQAFRSMVDSLNLRFKECPSDKEIYSLPQGWANYVTFASSDDPLTSIVEDIQSGTEFDKVMARYKNYVEGETTRILVVLCAETETEYVMSIGNPEAGYNAPYFEKSQFLTDMKGRWIYRYREMDKYTKQFSVSGWYLENGLVKTKIPTIYSRLIEYVDCMVDNNAEERLEKEWKDDKPYGPLKSATALRQYIKNRAGTDVNEGKKPFIVFDQQLMTLPEYAFAKENITNDKEMLRLLDIVANDCITYRYSDPKMEDLVKNNLSKQKALLMKKSRVVRGRCSRDHSPRSHALQIALLAAEANNWDIFLRAHLDILNDRFLRNADWSGEYDKRKTYLKELEELNLNIVDLMIGMAMRADDLPKHHYHGTTWRVGWALTESREQARFRQIIMEMMKDPELDEYNRGLAFMVYQAYLQMHDNKREALRLTEEFRSIASEFPTNLRPYILSIKDPSKEK